jgi:hypothetical protein
VRGSERRLRISEFDQNGEGKEKEKRERNSCAMIKTFFFF